MRDGRLPELTTQVPQDEVPLRVPDHGNRRIYTANHPPLYYLPVSLALRIGSPLVAFLTARLVSVAFGAAGVLLVALGLQQGGFWLLTGSGEPSGEPGASEGEPGAEPQPEPRADLRA